MLLALQAEKGAVGKEGGKKGDLSPALKNVEDDFRRKAGGNLREKPSYQSK